MKELSLVENEVGTAFVVGLLLWLVTLSVALIEVLVLTGPVELKLTNAGPSLWLADKRGAALSAACLSTLLTFVLWRKEKAAGAGGGVLKWSVCFLSAFLLGICCLVLRANL